MNKKKTLNEFVEDELNDFFEDVETSKKNIKLFTVFSKIDYTYDKTNIKIINRVKPKFVPKVKIVKKHNDKGIF
jgi:flavodoxin